MLPTRPALAMMYIDDSDGDRLLVETLLRGQRCRLHLAASGFDALVHLSTTRVDLVLLDLNMPDMDGFVVLVALRNHPACRLLPVVVFSSSSDPRDLRRAYELGANSFLRKPLNVDEFEALLNQLVQYWGEVSETVYGSYLN